MKLLPLKPSDARMIFPARLSFASLSLVRPYAGAVFTVFFALIAVLTLASAAHSAELVLAADGESDYQIIVPDTSSSPGLAEALNQTARLLQTAFQANGFAVPVVAEGKRDPAKPALFLGNTTFARQQGVEVAKLRGWSYVLRVSGRDVIIAGR